MSIPDTVHNTPEAVIKYLEDQVKQANDLWTNYAAMVANAYASAYKRQSAALGASARLRELSLQTKTSIREVGPPGTAPAEIMTGKSGVLVY